MITHRNNEGPLVPTFTSPLVSRKYTLKMSVHLRGQQHVKFELAVPVQIVHNGTCSENGLPESITPFTEAQPEGRIGDDGSSTSASEPAIISNEVLITTHMQVLIMLYGSHL